MKKRLLLLPLLFVLLLPATAKDPAPFDLGNGRQLHGPIHHENIGLYIVTGKEDFPASGNFVTLEEAMKQKWTVVHETGNVNQLAIENVTKDKVVVVPAGSVVKGGKQDRVLSMDLVLKPQSGKTPIASFCVEQSRWAPRGGEAVARFSGNDVQVSGKGLRKAVKGMQGQQTVWRNVAKQQQDLSSNIGRSVTQNASPTSYQLAVESKELAKEAAKYKAVLLNAPAKYPDAIGYAVTINGSFSTADIYGSRGLFRKMWKQHIDSAITEAIAEQDKAKAEKEKPGAKPAAVKPAAQAVDLAWRAELFNEASYATVQTNDNKEVAGALNVYHGQQNPSLFRYRSQPKVVPQLGQLVQPPKPVFRWSFEKREKGEALSNAPAEAPQLQQRGQFNNLNLNDIQLPQQRAIPNQRLNQRSNQPPRR